jgi:hypothetical protein
MSVATTLAFVIRRIAKVVPIAGGLRIVFPDGSTARLPASHPNFESLRIHAESAAGQQRPVGVVLESGNRVVDLNTAHDTTVRFLREDPANPGLLEVAFWGYSPACCLMRDHPEFERIHKTLTEAVETGRMVWLANHSEMAEVTLDGEAFLCWRIMDVRPVA